MKVFLRKRPSDRERKVGRLLYNICRGGSSELKGGGE